MDATTPKIVHPQDGDAGFLGSMGVRFLIDGAASDGRFSLLEHPMSPRALGAPLHRHAREDEYSFVDSSGTSPSWSRWADREPRRRKRCARSAHATRSR